MLTWSCASLMRDLRHRSWYSIRATMRNAGFSPSGDENPYAVLQDIVTIGTNVPMNPDQGAAYVL